MKESNNREVKIELINNGLNTEVYINGIDYSNAITSVEFKHRSDGLPIFRFEFLPSSYSFSSVLNYPDMLKKYRETIDNNLPMVVIKDNERI